MVYVCWVNDQILLAITPLLCFCSAQNHVNVLPCLSNSCFSVYELCCCLNVTIKKYEIPFPLVVLISDLWVQFLRLPCSLVMLFCFPGFKLVKY